MLGGVWISTSPFRALRGGTCNTCVVMNSSPPPLMVHPAGAPGALSQLGAAFRPPGSRGSRRPHRRRASQSAALLGGRGRGISRSRRIGGRSSPSAAPLRLNSLGNSPRREGALGSYRRRRGPRRPATPQRSVQVIEGGLRGGHSSGPMHASRRTWKAGRRRVHVGPLPQPVIPAPPWPRLPVNGGILARRGRDAWDGNLHKIY